MLAERLHARYELGTITAFAKVDAHVEDVAKVLSRRPHVMDLWGNSLADGGADAGAAHFNALQGERGPAIQQAKNSFEIGVAVAQRLAVLHTAHLASLDERRFEVREVEPAPAPVGEVCAAARRRRLEKGHSLEVTLTGWVWCNRCGARRRPENRTYWEKHPCSARLERRVMPLVATAEEIKPKAPMCELPKTKVTDTDEKMFDDLNEFVAGIADLNAAVAIRVEAVRVGGYSSRGIVEAPPATLGSCR